MSDKLLISVDEVCQRLSLGRSLFFQLRASGRFSPPTIKFGRKVLYRTADVQRWVADGCKASEDKQ